MPTYEKTKKHNTSYYRRNKVEKFITGHSLKMKGKRYKEIEFETLGVDNSSKMVKLKIIAPGLSVVAPGAIEGSL